MRFQFFFPCAAIISLTVATALPDDSAQVNSSPFYDDRIDLDPASPFDSSSIPPDQSPFSVVSNLGVEVNPDTINSKDLTVDPDVTDSTIRGDETLVTNACIDGQSHGNVHRRESELFCRPRVEPDLPDPDVLPATKPNSGTADPIPPGIKAPDHFTMPDTTAPLPSYDKPTNDDDDEKCNDPAGIYVVHVCCHGPKAPRQRDLYRGFAYFPRVLNCQPYVPPCDKFENFCCKELKPRRLNSALKPYGLICRYYSDVSGTL